MNDLEKYFGQIEGLTGFNPEIIKDAGASVMQAIDVRNDPTAWMAYAGTAIKQAWSALPKELRQQMYDAINDVIEAALEQAEFVGDALSDAAKGANAAPIVGQIIGAVIVLVGTIVESLNEWSAINRGISQNHKAMRMTVTFENYSDPRDWVFKSMKLENYTHYVGRRKQGNWSRQPCFRRAGLKTDRMFAATNGAPDKGKCGHKKGVSMKCPQRRKFGYEDCSRYYKNKKKNPPDYCTRHLGISALFYPYWSPAYPAEPISNAFLGTDSDPNGILMGRQTMLLADPYSNFRVVSKDLLAMTDRFVKWWRAQMKHYAVDGKMGLLKIDWKGNAPGTSRSERFTVDEKKDPNYTGSQSLQNRFYFDDDGRILPYPGMGANVSEWGIRTRGGTDRGEDGGSLAVSVGAYNAVITNTLAFFTARSNMLRNGNRMRGLLQDHSIQKFDPAVRDAIQYAADKGGMLPGPAVQVKFKTMQVSQGPTPIKQATFVGAPKKPSRFSLASTIIDDGPSETKSKRKKGSSKLPLLLGAAALGFVVMKKK